jgi:hypothetical protein
MSEEKRGKGRPRKGEGVTQVTFTLEPDVVRYLDTLSSGRKSEFVTLAIRERIERVEAMNAKLREVASQAIEQARGEGLDDDDARWLAVGAINREAREQGIVDDELAAEFNAAAQAIVKQVQS